MLLGKQCSSELQKLGILLMYFLEQSGKAQVRFSGFISYVFSVFLKIIIKHDLFLTGFRCGNFYYFWALWGISGLGKCKDLNTNEVF